MSEEQTTAHLMLQARSAEDIQMLVAVVSLGMCRALLEGAVSPKYACARLFGPALLRRMERLLDAVQLATELEDVSELVPHALDDSLREIERHLLVAVGSSAAKSADGERWLAPEERELRHGR